MWLCTHATFHATIKSKNNVKFCNSASYKSPKFISSSVVPNIDFLEHCLSSETVEMVSDLFLFHQQNYNFLVAFSGLNALFRLPRKLTSPEDCLNLQTVKAGDSLFITHHFISIIRHV